MTTIQYNIFNLKKQLEIQNQKEYSWAQIAELSDIHRNTVLNLANDRTQRVDLDVVARLLTFFKSEGMPVSIGDLFVVTDD